MKLITLSLIGSLLIGCSAMRVGNRERTELAQTNRAFKQYHRLRQKASAILGIPFDDVIVLKNRIATSHEGYQILSLAAAIQSGYFRPKPNSSVSHNEVALKWIPITGRPPERGIEGHLYKSANEADMAGMNKDQVVTVLEAKRLVDKLLNNQGRIAKSNQGTSRVR